MCEQQPERAPARGSEGTEAPPRRGASLMKLTRFLISGALAGFFLVLFLSVFQVQATLKYRKETGKKCTFCHVSIPEKGDEDPKLTKDGKAFKENGYQLTDEQKNRPE